LLELADIKWLEVDLITLQVFKVYMQQWSIDDII
jgi:hypothetical protein